MFGQVRNPQESTRIIANHFSQEGCLKGTLLNVDKVFENNTTLSTTAQLLALRTEWPLDRRYQWLTKAGASCGVPFHPLFIW